MAGLAKKLLTLIFLAAVFAGAYYLIQTSYYTEHITVLSVNDYHGQFVPQKRIYNKDGVQSVVVSGGALQLGAFIDSIRRDRKYPSRDVLFVSPGDIYQGTPEGDHFLGESVLELFAALDCDAVTPGNHDLDDGPENLMRLAGRAPFPILCANIREKATGLAPPFIKPYIIRNIRGVRVGLFGIITGDMNTALYNKKASAVYNFTPPLEAAAEYAAKLKDEGADIIICLSHCGRDEDIKLAGARSGIDVIIGGHSHSRVSRRVGQTFIMQAGSRSEALGRVDISYNLKNGRKKIKGTIIELSGPAPKAWRTGQGGQTQQRVKAVFAKYNSEINRLYGLDRETGFSPSHLSKSGEHDSPLGNLIADCIKKEAGAEVALHNRGGVRAEIFKGPVTVRDIYNVLPFPNTLCTVYLKGTDLRQMLEDSLDTGYGVLQMSGLEVRFDTSLPPGSRIISLTHDGRPVEPDREYLAASNSYIAKGGEGQTVFQKGRDFRDIGKVLREAFGNYIRTDEFKNFSYSPRISFGKR